MATAVIMPRQGNTVESCLIAGWKKQKGDQVTEGDVLCEVETDKALLEVESPASGTLLDIFFQEGDDVPVLTNIAVIGKPGENIDGFRPDSPTEGVAEKPAPSPVDRPEPVAAEVSVTDTVVAALEDSREGSIIGVSPRAKRLAEREKLDFTRLKGSGPGGRILERDVQAALEAMPKMTPLARTMMTQGKFSMPAQGSGVSGRVVAEDLGADTAAPTAPETAPMPPSTVTDEVETISVKGIRKVIADRMLESLQTTAQLTLNATADARALLAYRQKLKGSAETLGLQHVTLNDLILFAVSRTLPRYPELNALFTGDAISQYKNVHLAFAVDTPRGLMVPVIRNAHLLSLKQISLEARRLATACLEGTITPDELNGGTFTVTNLGSFGVDSFTPILNPPQVGILGVGGVNLKPVEVDGAVEFIPHLGLSLTINHQVVDGAPGARFLQALSQGLAQMELLLAV